MLTVFNRPVLLALLLGALPLSASAHRTWLLPSSTVLDGKEPWVTFDAAVSEDVFDLDGSAQQLDALFVLDPDGEKLVPENAFTGKLRSSFDLKLSKSGTYRVGMVRESVMASYKVGEEMKRFRGTEADMAKQVPADAKDLRVTHLHARQETFVTANKVSSTASKPSGVGIELQPLTHPNEMFTGDTAKFRLLVDGKPLANHLLGIVPGGVRYRSVLNEIAVATDVNGEFSVKWPAAGMYWLNASYPARSAMPPGAPVARRVSYSATLEVLPQ